MQLVGSITGCLKNYVLINYTGDKGYSAATTNTYCENRSYSPVTSTGNELNVLYDNRNTMSKGFILKYLVV